MTLTVPDMTGERFADLAEIYGGDVARWPEGEREAARALLVAQPERLAPLLSQAAQLDRLLDLAPAQAPTAALLGRLIAAGPQPATAMRRWIAGLGAAFSLAAAAVAGLAVGLALGREQAPAAQPPAAEAVIAADFTDDLSEALREPAEL